MTTSELISYIKKQINNNISKDLIILKLTSAGWHKDDIDEGFLKVEQQLGLGINPIEIEIEKAKDVTDLSTEEPKKENNNLEVFNTELSSVNITDQASLKKEDLETKTAEIKDYKDQTPNLEVFNKELSAGEILLNKIVVVETPKIWVPQNTPIKVVPNISSDILDLDKKIEPVKPLGKETLVPKKEEDKEDYFSNREDPDKKLDTINPKYFNKNEELIPNLIPKIKVDSLSPINTQNLTKQEVPNISTVAPVLETQNEPAKNYIMENLPQRAMLSSYESDLLSVNKTREEFSRQKVGNKNKKWLIVVGILLVIALFIFLFMKGFINFEKIKNLIVKEDPKVILLNNSKVLSSLKSYKTETNLEISSPSFASISAGLTSGEAVVSDDKDSISIKTLGIINQENGDLLTDDSVEIKSSILKDSVTLNIKEDKTGLFILFSDISQIIEDSLPKQTIVKINKDQFGLLPPLFSPENEERLSKVNLYNVLSKWMPSFINNDTLGVYDEFINNVEIIKKGQEDIKGIATYHYSVSPDRQLSKKLLNKISDNFVLNLSNDDQDRLSEILGSVVIRSFEVWVGKGDNNIYQYNVILDIPVSKIIDFQDKSIGDNLVTISWKTTYYDFDVLNKIVIPQTSTPIIDFVNEINEKKIKKEVDSFKQIAVSLSNAEGFFGSKSNTGGSCMNPTLGTLFSPLGHTKGSTAAVSSISELLNNIMTTTNGAGFCYSTPKAWSFTVPISDNYFNAEGQKYFYCVDNTGAKLELINPPTGVVCK